ncbi:MAG: DUF29 domain-containing protein [Alphaproteobacteria bacterium]
MIYAIIACHPIFLRGCALCSAIPLPNWTGQHIAKTSILTKKAHYKGHIMGHDYPKHNEDVYGWAIHTAHLLREKRMDELDFDDILEEIEALGRSEMHELISRLAVVITHLLKWQYQPNLRSKSWMFSIREQRKQSKLHLKHNPSLKSILDDIVVDAYDISITRAEKETGIEEKEFPKECPYTFEQILDQEFFPE